jgi:hypothetical protein
VEPALRLPRFDLGNIGLADADALRQLFLGQPARLAQGPHAGTQITTGTDSILVRRARGVTPPLEAAVRNSMTQGEPHAAENQSRK